MRKFRRNVIIGAIGSAFVIGSEVRDTPALVARERPVDELNVEETRRAVAAEMNQATGLCMEISMRKGLSPDSTCIVEEPLYVAPVADTAR